MSSLFINILGTNMSKGAALYSDMNSATNRDSALRSIALAALNERELHVFDAVIKLVKACQKTRDKLAHWYWGTCAEMDDGLVLVDPRYLMRYRAEILDWRSAGDLRGAQIDLSQVYAVRTKFLDETAETFTHVAKLVFDLANLVAQAGQQKRGARLRALFADGMVQEALPQSMRSAIQRSLQAQPRLPGKPRRK